MELLYNKLVEIFENDSSCGCAAKISDMSQRRELIAQKTVRSLFKSKIYTFYPGAATDGVNYIPFFGLLEIRKTGNKYEFQYYDRSFTVKADDDFVSYVMKMLEVYKSFIEKGDAYAYGNGVEKDMETAMHYYEQTVAYRRGEGEKDGSLPVVAAGIYMAKKYLYAYTACNYVIKSGLALKMELFGAYYVIGLIYQHGFDIPQDYEKALEMYNIGLDMAPTHEVMIYQKAYVLLSLKKYDDLFALVWNNRKDWKVHNFLGECYLYGYGVDKSPWEARRYFESYTKGDVNGYYSLAFLERHLRNGKKFVEYVNKCLENDLFKAHELLGYAYQYGFGIAKDNAKAREQYEIMLTQHGDYGYIQNTYYHLGCLYREEGEFEKALEFLHKAHDRNYWAANAVLAEMYLKGQGTHEDYETATGLLYEGLEENNAECFVKFAECILIGSLLGSEDTAFECLKKAVELEKDTNIAIRTYIKHAKKGLGSKTLKDLIENFTLAANVYELRPSAVGGEFLEFEDFYKKHFVKLCELPKKQPGIMREGVRAALYFYRTKQYCHFIDVETLEIYKLYFETVVGLPESDNLGAWYGVEIAGFEPVRAKALTIAEMMRF